MNGFFLGIDTSNYRTSAAIIDSEGHVIAQKAVLLEVPAGKIMIELSAYPIKNYATNHLYVSGSNGASGGVDWGPTSDVETRSDSFDYDSSSSQTFTIDYYETVSWEVTFYRYQ